MHPPHLGAGNALGSALSPFQCGSSLLAVAVAAAFTLLAMHQPSAGFHSGRTLRLTELSRSCSLAVCRFCRQSKVTPN